MDNQNFATIEVVPSMPVTRPFARRREPVRLGVPVARGVCDDPARVVLSDAAGRRRPAQVRPLARWSDGSIRWLLVDFQADHDGRDAVEQYRLGFADPAPPPIDGPLRIAQSHGEYSIDTGAARFVVRPADRFPLQVLIDERPVLDPQRARIEIEDDRNRNCSTGFTGAELEESGALRAVVRLDGWADAGAGGKLAQIVARLHFFSGTANVQFEVTLRNPRRAEHPGGFWELGDPGSIFLRDLSLTMALPPADGPTRHECAADLEAEVVSGTPLDLYQCSSGGANWQSRAHLNRHGVVPLVFSGYRLRSSGREVFGTRATPLVSVTRGAQRLSLTMPKFWQNFPKTVEVDGDLIRLRLFPRQHGDLHELQGGEQKTHTFFVGFGHDPVSDLPLDWTRAPLLARATPRSYARGEAVPYLLPEADDPNAEYLDLVRAADAFDRKRECIDQYGWRNFGDLHADHEQRYYSGPWRPLVSHYNNQYDGIGGFAVQFLRSGDRRWWRHMSDLASHVVDIDLYHTDRDKAAYNHGLFWHSAHYTDAGTSSHRSYPRADGISGGGPSAEHNYTSGLLLHYFLTGHPASRAAVIELATWVINLDDGARTPLRWLSRADTGYASATFSSSHHGPGRGAGFSINALLDAHLLTGQPEFLAKAETLIRRCIHPDDDIEGRTLLDAERRWSYTVFLYVLGKYLDYKAERNEIDAAYAYAREALLAYARWMAVRERPYLDHAEQLEFPTETWAAQDMWKSDVFKFAAKHASGEERGRFLERAEFFFRYSTRTLLSLPTRTFTRPTVLMLSHGYMQAYFQRNPEVAAPPPEGRFKSFGQPSAFVPQKTRAMQVAVAGLVAAGALAFVAAVLGFLTR